MRYMELVVVTERESGEAVCRKLWDLGSGGVMIDDVLDWETVKKESLGDIFPEVSKEVSSAITVRGYFPLSSSVLSKVNELKDFLSHLPEYGLPPAGYTFRAVDGADWEQAWKQYWKPTPAGRSLLIVPAWLSDVQAEGRKVLRLDPGAAFGTGTHESTRLCLELVEKYLWSGATVLDLGCGSGILALAAGLLGAGPVTGVDSDEAAIRSSRENAVYNLMPEIAFMRADLSLAQSWRNLKPAHLVLANLTADLLIAFSDRIKTIMLPEAKLIVSGLVGSRRDDVLCAFLSAGYKLREERSDGQWRAFCLELK